MNRIDTILTHAKGPTVLDLGSVQHDLAKTQKDGWLHKYLHHEFERVIGVDILCKEVELLSSEGPYEMVCQDVENLDLDMKFDTIIAGELIEHLSNPGQMLDNVKEHLHPHGRFILSTPNPWALVHLRRGLRDQIRINDEHTAWFGPVTMRQLLNRHGFELDGYTGVRPDHKGFMRFAKYMGIEQLSSTTWVFVATHK